jgi:cytochrome c553
MLIAACGTSEGLVPDAGPWDEGVRIPDEAPVPGDAEAGFQALVSNGYISCGIPLSVFPIAQTVLGSLAQSPPLTDADGELLRSGKNADVPYNWNVHTRAGVDLVSPNCLQCHAEKLNGTLVIGLGNVTADYTGAPEAGGGADPFAAIDLDAIPGGDQLRKLNERQATIGPYSTMATVGTNPAVPLTFALAAYKEPETLAWLDEPAFALPTVLFPTDVPPWWRTKKKSSHFYNGMSRGDHRGTMILASMVCTDSNEEADEIMDYFDDLYAYIRSIEPPLYPFEVDEAVAARGESVFLDNCAGCHGTYGASDDEDTYPNLIVPLDVIETDPAFAAYNENVASLQAWFDKTFFAQYSTVIVDDPFPGYTAPPLDGIWATAPYLHNGSVPTIEAVIDPIQRPKYWKRADFDSTHYDKERLGWPYESLTYGQSEAREDERKYIYDTTLVGHSNAGHTFGTHLDERQRATLVEYLKTL